MSLKPISRETRIYLALWRKAGTLSEPLVIKLSSYSEAISLRMGLYRAIKPYREGTSIDPELQTISESYSASARKGSKEVIIGPKTSLATIENMMEGFGIAEEDLLTFEEKELGEKLNSFLSAPVDEHKAHNPFFERDDR